MTEKQGIYLSAAAVLFVNDTRDPEQIATRLLGKAKRGVSARSLERWRAEHLDYWRKQLTSLGWDVSLRGDNFSVATGEARGRKNTDYLRACATLEQMPAGFTNRQRVKSLKALMPGYNPSTYTKWVTRWTKETHAGTN